MDEKLDKQVFEVHMRNMYKMLEKLDENTSKLFERQDAMNVTLAKNTVTVKEHHIRSTRLEEVQEQMLITIQNMNSELRLTKKEVIDLDTKVVSMNKSLEPIKTHVGKVNRSFEFFQNLPKFIKWIAVVLVSISAILGVISGTSEINDMVKFLMK